VRLCLIYFWRTVGLRVIHEGCDSGCSAEINFETTRDEAKTLMEKMLEVRGPVIIGCCAFFPQFPPICVDH